MLKKQYSGKPEYRPDIVGHKSKSITDTASNQVMVVDGLLDERQLSRLLNRSVPSIQKDRFTGGGVPFIRLGKRMVRYRISDVEEWLESRVRRSTSDPGPAAA